MATGNNNDALALAININLAGATQHVIVNVGAAGDNYATTPSNIISGAVAVDMISFRNNTYSSSLIVVNTTGQDVAADSTALLNALDGCDATVAYVVSNGNTYAAESQTDSVGAADTTLIELTGIHSFTASTGSITVVAAEL